MKQIPSLLLLSILTACSHEAKKVDCESHLTAINAPTPIVKSDATHPPTSYEN
jgi:hypothetical protein